MATFTVYRGDSLSFDLALTDENGIAVDLTGCQVWMTAKVKPALDADASAVFQVGTTLPLTGITLTNAPLGLASILVPPGLMTGLASYPAKLVYDIQVKDPAHNIWTADYGVLTVIADATWAG